MNAALLVALGGAIGTVGRYLVGVGVAGQGGPGWLGTALVNVLGAFCMGALVGVAPGPNARVFFATGVLGGFTTFSALTLDTATLAEGGGELRAAAYAVGSLALGIAAFFLGRFAARA